MIKVRGKEYTEFDDTYNDPAFLDPVEKAKIEFEVAFISKMIEARESRGITQKQLAEMSGVKQPAISRMESMEVTPQIDTLFKILNPLGYTLDIVPTNG